MADLIDRGALKDKISNTKLRVKNPEMMAGLVEMKAAALREVENAQTVESEVVRCKDCIYFKPAHVRCDDGTERDYSEFPAEAFEPYFGLGVTTAYGINVSSQCVYDEWCGAYSDDKTVFRRADDYCSRGKRKTEVNKNAGSIHAE